MRMTGLEMLVRRFALERDEWVRLIEARRDIMKPFLASFNFPELGSFDCMRSEVSSRHMLWLDDPTLSGDSAFSLTTEGIFQVQPWEAIERIVGSGYRGDSINCPDGVMRLWGLTRSGDWIIVTIGFIGEAGYKGRGYERARTVTVVKANLSRMFMETKEDPNTVFSRLGREIKGWAEHRERLAKQAASIACFAELEEHMLSLITEED